MINLHDPHIENTEYEVRPMTTKIVLSRYFYKWYWSANGLIKACT
jgi:hypothetical protein